MQEYIKNIGVWRYDNTSNIKWWRLNDEWWRSLEGSGLSKGVTETVQNEVKEQKEGFISMLLGTLGASLLGNLLTDRGKNRAGKGRGINRAGEGIARAGYGSRSSKMNF